MKLKDTLSVQTASGEEWRMFAHIVRNLKKLGCNYWQDDVGNLYACKGSADTFPCVVAHMDTVHDLETDFTVCESKGVYYAMNMNSVKQVGVGGDDKVGVWIALKCLQSLPACKAVFFVSEETGCEGSGVSDLSFFGDCRFVLQADRKGKRDFITEAGGYSLSSQDFQNAVKPYTSKRGFRKESGMMTDVMELTRRGVGISTANVSCGYHNPHTSTEYVVIKQAENTLGLFLDICRNLNGVYPHTSAYKWGGSSAYKTGAYSGYVGQAEGKYTNILKTCSWCSVGKPTKELTYSSIYMDYLCKPCALEVEQWSNGMG